MSRSVFRDYFYPSLIRPTSAQSQTEHQSGRDEFWKSYADHLADERVRAGNRQWIAHYGNVFVRRWAVVFAFSLLATWVFSGEPLIGLPLIVLDFVAAAHVFFFALLRRVVQ